MTADLLRAEWTKLRSLRSTVWSLLAAVGLALGITALATSVYTNGYDELDAADRAQMNADPIGLILQPAAGYGGIAVCVLGVMVIASEYSTGMIRATLLAVPRRTPVLAAKAAVFGAVVLIVGELTAFAAFLIGRTIVAPRVQVTLDDPAVLRAVAGFGLYLCVLGLVALAIGALIRHVAGAIATTLGVIVALPTLVSFLPGSAGEHIAAYLPSQAGSQLLSSGSWPTVGPSGWGGFGVMCAEAAVLLLAAWYLLKRRDAE